MGLEELAGVCQLEKSIQAAGIVIAQVQRYQEHGMFKR